MNVSISSDVTETILREVNQRSYVGLYVDRYDPGVFQNALSDLPNQGGTVLGSGEGVVEGTICEMYDSYARMLSLQSEGNIAVCVTEYYTKALHRYWDVVSEELEVYCKVTGQDEVYNVLSKIVSEVGVFLGHGFQTEIRDNMTRYVLQPVSYYVGLANHRMVHLRGSGKKEKTDGVTLCQNNANPALFACEVLLEDSRERLDYFTTRAQLRYD